MEAVFGLPSRPRGKVTGMKKTIQFARAWTRPLPRRTVSVMDPEFRCGGRAALALLVTFAAALAVVVVGVVGASEPAGATLPGENGRLALAGSGKQQLNYDIHTVNPDGSDAQRLTNSIPRRSAYSSYFATWSPDGTRIAFIQTVKPFNDEIFVMNADGTAKKRLTFTGAFESDNLYYGQRLAFSPDGSKLFYERARSVWSMNADGTGQKRLPYEPRLEVAEFALSPDGQKIALVAYYERRYDIWVMNADGSDLTRITQDRAWDEHVGWSPDSSRLVFAGDVGIDRTEGIVTMNAEGTERTALTTTWWDSQPSWSPDGTRIAFERDGIMTVNVDGTGETQLSEETWNTYYPEWSPDSTRVAYTLYEGSFDGSNIHIVNADGSGEPTVIDLWPFDEVQGWQTVLAGEELPTSGD